MTNFSVPFQDFTGEAKLKEQELQNAFLRVLRSGWYILGPEVELFEREFAKYLGVKHVIGVANGQEAIQIALMALGIGSGDEVITTPLSAIATTLAILTVGATPIFVDTDKNGLIDPRLIEEKITTRTKALLPVHLYGNVCEIDKLLEICKTHNIFLIEDAAQAHGAEFSGQKAGTFGAFGCFSFYPTKNLGAIGDAGAVVTNDENLAELAKKMRNYGQSAKYVHTHPGLNSRLDELQAALLRVKLKYLSEEIERRRNIAQQYEMACNKAHIQTLKLNANTKSARHLFIIKSENRDQLRKHLAENSIETLIHYPTLIPDQPVFASKYYDVNLSTARKFIQRIVSIPIHGYITYNQVSSVSSLLSLRKNK